MPYIDDNMPYIDVNLSLSPLHVVLILLVGSSVVLLCVGALIVLVGTLAMKAKRTYHNRTNNTVMMPPLSGTTDEGCNIIRATYSFQETRLYLWPIVGKLYQEGIIGRDMRDAITELRVRIDQARTLLNYLDGQPPSLLFKYVRVLEESAESDGLACHAEIAQELRRFLGYSPEELRSDHPDSQEDGNHYNDHVRRPSSTDDELYPGPPPLISLDSDNSFSDLVDSLPELNSSTCTSSNTTDLKHSLTLKYTVPTRTCDQSRSQAMSSRDLESQTTMIAIDAIHQDKSSNWGILYQSTGNCVKCTPSDEITCPYCENNIDVRSTGNEDSDLSSGSEEDNMEATQSYSASRDQLYPHEFTILFGRKKHTRLLKANAHQREFMKLWNIYMCNIKGAKQCVKEILQDPFNSLDYCISMTMAGRDYSPHSISIIERTLKKTLKRDCLNPEIFQCRLRCHLVDCYLNSENYSEALKQVKIALQLAEVIMPDVSSAWAWCMYAWLMYWEYSDIIDDLPFAVENEIEDALSKAVDYSNHCPELHWLAESVKLGKAHWHFEMVENYRHIWNDYNGSSAHLGVGREALQNVHTGLLNTFGMGYYHTLWCRYYQLSGRMQAASVSAGEAVKYYLKVKRYQHALVVAGDIAAYKSLVSYIQNQMHMKA